MKYFKDNEKLYWKFFIISKSYLILNSNTNIISYMSNTKLNFYSDGNNKEYNIIIIIVDIIFLII